MNFRFLQLSTRKARSLFIGAVALSLTAGSFAFLRIFHLRDITAYRGMAQECHPVWRQFAFRRFGRGDSVADLLKKYPPTRTEAFGRYGIYQFHGGSSNDLAFTSFSAIAKDGKLVTAAAGSCTWQFTFFHTPDSELDRQYAQFSKERHVAYKRQLLANLGIELQKFCSHYSRWPTNPIEFSDFVTQLPSATTNDLGITFRFHDERVTDLSLIQLPGEFISVTNPAATAR